MSSTSTKYFIMAKPKGGRVDSAESDQVVFLNDNDVHILPYVNVGHYVTRGLFEAAHIEFIKRFCSPNKIFIDVGAHTGTYSISLADYSSHVFSFEPQRQTYYALCGGVALSGKKNVSCFQFGLGSEAQVGLQKLNLVSADGGGSSLHDLGGLPVLGAETVHIKTLDSLGIWTEVGLIKIDVEQNELEVLKGGTKTLQSNGYPAILFESKFDTGTRELVDFLFGLGYSATLTVDNNLFLAVKVDREPAPVPTTPAITPV